MRKLAVYFALFTVLLLAGCQQEALSAVTPPLASPQPAATHAAVASAKRPSLPTPEAITTTPEGRPATGTLYLPSLHGSAVTPTPVATATPTATPEPAYPRYDGPPINRSDFGIQLHLHQEDRRWLLRHLQALDVGWVKVQVSWKVYQPYPDQLATDRFEELDWLVEAATNNGMDVLLGVSKAPEWSRPTTEMDGPPSDYDLYRDFMETLAGRYRGRVAAYELWNEPNLQREWNGVPLSAADFVRLMAAGAEGVRAADPQAIVISGAPATTGINDGETAVDDRVYLRQMLTAGAADLVDAVGVHPYGWANPPDSSVANPDPDVPSHNDHPSFFFGDTINDYRALLEAFDAADKPLWATEFGWGTFETFGVSPPDGAEFMNNVSEWQQAVYTLRAYELAHEWDYVGPMILWNLNFAPTLGPDFSESGYSVLRPDGSRRPVYRSLEQMDKVP